MTRSDLSARASTALRLIVQLRYLSQRQLVALLFGDSAMTAESRRVIVSRLISSLKSAHLIRELDRVVGGPGGGSSAVVYRATSEGRWLAAVFDPTLSGSPTTDGPFLQRHSQAVADVLIALRDRPEGRLMSWRTDWQIGRDLGRLPILPDLHVELATKDLEIEALVEVDLGTEGHRFFDEKMRRYLRLWRSGTWQQVFRDWPLVLVVSTTDQRSDLKRWTERIIETEPDWRTVMVSTEFAFVSLPLLKHSGWLAHIWQVAGSDQPHSLVQEVAL